MLKAVTTIVYAMICALFFGQKMAGAETAEVEPVPVIITSIVDRAIATTKDDITFTITLRTKAQFSDLQIPEVADEIQGFRVIDFGSGKSYEDEDGYLIKDKWYRLKADFRGSYVLPDIKITYEHQGKPSEAATSEIFVEVTETKAKEGEQPAEGLRDIKGLAQPKRFESLVIGSVVGLILVLVILIVWLRKRRSANGNGRQLPPEPCHVVALRGLEKLKQEGLLEKGEIKRFHFIVSSILRNYIEGRYHYLATDKTLDEIKRDIETIERLDKARIENLLAIFTETDLVKFSDFKPSDQRSLQILDEVQSFIDETKEEETREGQVI